MEGLSVTLQEYQTEYERLFQWRERWIGLSSKREPGRLQTRQEAIERRASIANNRIGALIQKYDAAQRANHVTALCTAKIVMPCKNCADMQRALVQVARENRSLEKRIVQLQAKINQRRPCP